MKPAGNDPPITFPPHELLDDVMPLCDLTGIERGRSLGLETLFFFLPESPDCQSRAEGRGDVAA